MILCSIAFLFLLLFFPETALSGSKYGAALWLTQLLPTLLPFFIAIRLLDSCLPQVTSKKSFLLIGLLCGYPAGAALVAGQYDRGLLSRRAAYFFLGAVNNPSPMFVLVFCGHTVLGLTSSESFLLFGVLILASFLGSGLIYCAVSLRGRRSAGAGHDLKIQSDGRRDKNISPSPTQIPAVTGALPLSAALDRIILDSFILLTKIGGYVILFSILGQFLSRLLPAGSLLSGFLEITTGASYLQQAALSPDTKKVLMATLLTFGGFSAAAQTNSILSKSELSILPYLFNKAVNCLIAGTLLLVHSIIL